LVVLSFNPHPNPLPHREREQKLKIAQVPGSQKRSGEMRPLTPVLPRLRARRLISSLAFWERARVRAVKEDLLKFNFL
jgi:hypothetical protein